MISNGIDLVYIPRLQKLINDENFLNRYFSQEEINYINGNVDTLAGMYASKEAFLKAIKKGINKYNLKDIQVGHNDEGMPYIVLNEAIKKEIDYQDLSLSISHDNDYAIAIVTILL